MNVLTEILNEWQERQLVGPEQRQRLEARERTRPVSLFLFLRSLLSTGVLLLTAGLGIVIYQHIDTIGHEALLILLASLTAGCFYYAYRHRPPLSTAYVASPKPLADYVLLLGCMLFLVLEGYAQWRYNLFGTRYGLATLLPALLFLFCAYRFDHRGVLSMGLTALASWAGLTVTPLRVWAANDLSDPRLVLTALGVGTLLVGASYLLERRAIKPHFSYTYWLLGGNLFLVAALAGVLAWELSTLLYALGLTAGCAAAYFYARRSQSFLFLLMAVVYGYVGFTYLLFRVMPEEFWAFFGLLYVVGSAVGVLWFFLNYKKILSLTPPSHETIS